MADYRWRLWHVRGWYEVGYLPLRTVSFGWKLNDIGPIQASLPLRVGSSPILPGEHAVIVERDRLPIWFGPIWPTDFDTSSGYLSLNGSEWASYLRRRRIRLDRSMTGADQFDIARTLISDSQGAFDGHGDLRIDVYAGRGSTGRTLSGVIRDRSYKAVERKELWEALTQLAAVSGGFDQRLRPVYLTDGTPAVWWEAFYPQQGPSQDRTGIVLEFKEGWPGSNVIDYRWRITADAMANVAEAANDVTVATATDPGAWTRYPLLEALDQRGGEHGVSDVATLQAHADALLEANRRPMVSGTLTLKEGPWVTPELIGAQVRVRLTSWRHPAGPHGEPGFDGVLRIVSMSVQAPSDQRGEQVSVELGPIPLPQPRGYEVTS